MYSHILNIFQSLYFAGADEVCVPPLLAHGLVEPKQETYASQDVVRVSCQEGYEVC